MTLLGSVSGRRDFLGDTTPALKRVRVARTKARHKRTRMVARDLDSVLENLRKRAEKHNNRERRAAELNRLELSHQPNGMTDESPEFWFCDPITRDDPDFSQIDCRVQPGCWMFGDLLDEPATDGQPAVPRRRRLTQGEVDWLLGEVFGDPEPSCLEHTHCMAAVYEIFNLDPEVTGIVGFRVFTPRGATYA